MKKKIILASLFFTFLNANNLFINFDKNIENKKIVQIEDYSNRKDIEEGIEASFEFASLDEIENLEQIKEEKEKQEIKKIKRKIEINFFGFTHHVENYFDEKTMEYKAPDNSTNVGLGINYYFYDNFFITFDFFKNCLNFDSYIVGVGYLFKNIINIGILKNKFDILFGTMYFKTKYKEKNEFIEPFYFLRYNLTEKLSINFSYIPSQFSPSGRDKFIFAVLTFKYK